MLNSLLLFGGSFGKNEKISKLISVVLIINLLIVQLGKVNLIFTIFNVFIMFGLTFIIRKISNKKINAIMSVLSILIWSILIDFVSYYIFPISNNASILQYLINGIIFNIRFVFANTGVLFVIGLLSYFKNKIKNISSNIKVINKIANV